MSGQNLPRQRALDRPGGTGQGSGPRFAVIVGTDHHPFDRLIGWVNDWLALHPDQAGAFFVQSGPASVAPLARSAAFLDAAELGRVLDESDVTICHGGPGSIADAWQRGQLPIAVPRLRRFGEVVDDHQVDFCRKLAEAGRLRLAEDAAQLAALITEALTGLAGFRHNGQPAGAAIETAVRRFDALVSDLIGSPRHRLPPIVRARRSRRPASTLLEGKQ